MDNITLVIIGVVSLVILWILACIVACIVNICNSICKTCATTSRDVEVGLRQQKSIKRLPIQEVKGYKEQEENCLYENCIVPPRPPKPLPKLRTPPLLSNCIYENCIAPLPLPPKPLLPNLHTPPAKANDTALPPNLHYSPPAKTNDTPLPTLHTTPPAKDNDAPLHTLHTTPPAKENDAPLPPNLNATPPTANDPPQPPKSNKPVMIAADATPGHIGGYCITPDRVLYYYSVPISNLPWPLERKHPKYGHSSDFEMKNLLFALYLFQKHILDYKSVVFFTDNSAIRGTNRHGAEVRRFIHHLKRCHKIKHLNSQMVQVIRWQHPEVFEMVIVPADHLSREREHDFLSHILENNRGFITRIEKIVHFSEVYKVALSWNGLKCSVCGYTNNMKMQNFTD